MLKKTIILSLLVALAIGQIRYPLFKQCDNRWGSNLMGRSQRTICRAGCFITCISMILNGCGVSINRGDANPGSLNIWLTNNRGY